MERTKKTPTETGLAELRRENQELREALATVARYVSPHLPIPWNVSPALDRIRQEHERDLETRPHRAPEQRAKAVA